VGVRHVLQIVYEVRRQSRQDFCLTVEQATFGMLGGGPGGLEINTMEGEFGFQLFNFRSRGGRRRWSLDLHIRGGRGSQRRDAIIVYVASDSDATWLCARRIQSGGGACPGDITGACRVTVNEPAAIRAAGGGSDG